MMGQYFDGLELNFKPENANTSDAISIKTVATRCFMGGFTDFEPSELWALAQLCKRINGAMLKALSANETEENDMLNGIIKLADLLAQLGYKPR